MPSRHHRSRSPSPERDRSRSPEHRVELPEGAKPISESDYFLKLDEFRVWLKHEKRKYFDELSGDRARSYFRKFVKAWNRGKLSRSLYRGVDPSTSVASSQTAYKWSFASKKSKVDDDAIRAVREEVGAATYSTESSSKRRRESFDRTSGEGSSPRGAARGSSGGRPRGPTLPSASDIAYARELEAEHQAEERVYKRKRDKLEAKERVEDMVGPKEVGREAMLEKKRARREADRTFREKGDDGFEADESTLMGGGDSFKDMVARRDAARRRHDQDKVAATRERVNVYREKEKATMDMFQQLAKQRFG